MLIDGGSTSKKNIAEYTLVPALKYYGTDHLDYVIITHTDEDHISGIRELFEQNYPIKHIVLPDTKAMNSSNAIQKAGKRIFLLKNKQNRSTELWCNSSALPASPKGMGGRRYQQWFSGIVSYL